MSSTLENTKKIIVKNNSPSIQSFYDYLERFRIKNDNPKKITHTSWGKVMGKFHIPNEQSDEFHKIYSSIVLQGLTLNMIEQHTDVSPIIIDFDFKYDAKIGEVITRKFDINHISNIVRFYMDEIELSFHLTDKNKQLTAFVFMREEPYEFKDNVKDGIHIIFPYVVSYPAIQFIIRDNVIKRLTQSKLLDDIGMKNSINEVVDRSVIEKNGWFLFGSSKPHTKKYELFYIFDNALNQLQPNEVDYGGINDMPKFFSIRRFTPNDCLDIKIEKNDELEKIAKRQNNLVINKLKKYHGSNYDVKQLHKMLDILNDCRAIEHDKWMEVGWCLHNINSDDIELLNLWKEFTMKKYPKFKDGKSKRSCELEWNKMRKNGSTIGKKLGMGSIYYWARSDNFEEYMNIKRQDIRYHIDKSMNCSNYDIAKVLHELYKYQFVCASIKNHDWYQFKNHRWQMDDGGITLRMHISTDLVDEYIRIVSDLNVEVSKVDLDTTMTDAEKEKEKERIGKKNETLFKIIQSLKTTSFKDNIMKECRELFYDNEFLNKLDENHYLIGFNNGIFDLEKYEFRDGEPDDYVSMTTGNDYIEYDENNKQLDEIMEVMCQIVPSYNVREYILKLFASMLQGYNAEEKIRIFTGSSGNGKSKLLELFTLAIGDYAGSFPVTLFTGKRAQSNAANPEVAKSKGKRYMQIDEPDEGANINAGLFKQHSGNDKIQARSLFKEPIEFKPQYKMILVCNDIPKVPAHDGGIWRRLEIIEFISRFVVDPQEENEFPRDDKLAEKLVMWKESFMSLIVYYYKKYRSEGLNPPIEITKFTRDFQKNCDNYAEFIITRLEKLKVDSNTASNQIPRVSVADIYKNFKNWIMDNGGNTMKVITKGELKMYLVKKFGKKLLVDDNLVGFRLRDIGEVVTMDDEDIVIDAPPEHCVDVPILQTTSLIHIPIPNLEEKTLPKKINLFQQVAPHIGQQSGQQTTIKVKVKKNEKVVDVNDE